MKRTKILLAALAIMAIGTVQAQLNVGVPAAPVSSAVLQATSTTKGFLPPVMSNAQMNAIASPAAGLIIYCTDCSPASIWYYNGSGWVPIGSSKNTTTYGCSSATLVQNPTGVLTNNTTYTGSYTIPYTAGNGGGYGSSTQTVNGLTLTRVAGTLSTGGGNVVYNLSGTTPASSAASVAFTIPECSFAVFGDAIRGGLTAGGCTSCAAYDGATVNTWVHVTAAEYAAVFTNVSGSGKYGVTDAQMATSPPTNGVANGFTWTTTASQTLVPSANYPFAMQIVSGQNASSNTGGLELKLSPTSLTSGYANYPLGASLSAMAAVANTAYYFVIKRPTVATSAASYIALYASTFDIGGCFSGTGYYATGDSNTPNSVNGSQSPLIQVLSTPTKQW